ncbi:MurR/RpiR family transcriptional regulator [Isobaculum melis]|uniref:DNA-binding transcriptional regulator, MurR/RpiR family, contains HTH and SIS domains n=1 Tax=Isobaculum melis TaxID=142588 RepID=A0A1H9Q536_9LACT|nr:MurR/RpiR family transcriptional regulator [Isobaculum melis]SER55039.1 DNA-binding transcriptional regulator, MurR/RpiR family, contains HTH and SIS domains [Isobaculum melis]
MGVLIDFYGNKLDDLSDSEKNVFFELDNHPELINQMNLTDLAHHLASSNSTIIRLAQRLGFQGFSQFKYELSRLLSQTIYIEEKDLVTQYRHFFEQSLHSLTLESLEYFAKRMKQAENLFIVGVGLTKPIAEYMCKRLYQLNCPSMYIYESHMLDLLPQFCKQNDLVIFISMSGETGSLLTSAKKVKQKNIAILSITNSQYNSLNSLSLKSISAGIPTNTFHNYDITSRSFLMIHIDLILELFLKKYTVE